MSDEHVVDAMTRDRRGETESACHQDCLFRFTKTFHNRCFIPGDPDYAETAAVSYALLEESKAHPEQGHLPAEPTEGSPGWGEDAPKTDP